MTDFLFLVSKITVGGDRSNKIKRCLLLGRKAITNPDNVLNIRDITLPTKVCPVKAMIFPVVVYGCEGWTIKKAERKNWCFSTMVLEKTLESPSDSKEIKPVNPKGNQPWIFIGRTDSEAKALILWLPYAESGLTGKDPDAGKDWRQEEKGMTEDEMVGWHHQFDGHEFEQALGNGDGQGSLACCSPWGCRELDTTERMKNNEKRWKLWTLFTKSFHHSWGKGTCMCEAAMDTAGPDRTQS